MRKSTWAAVAATAVVAGTVPAVTATPAAAKPIYACVHKKSGKTKVLRGKKASTKKCGKR